MVLLGNLADPKGARLSLVDLARVKSGLGFPAPRDPETQTIWTFIISSTWLHLVLQYRYRSLTGLAHTLYLLVPPSVR